MKELIAVLSLVAVVLGLPAIAADLASEARADMLGRDKQRPLLVAYRYGRHFDDNAEMEEEDASAGDDQQVAGRYGQNRPELVQFNNGSLRLYGALWKPAGKGPFPAVIYNHGSDPKPNIGATSRGGYGNIGRFYSQHGFVCLVPLRRGHTFRQGRRMLCTSDGVMFNSPSGPTVDQGAADLEGIT